MSSVIPPATAARPFVGRERELAQIGGGIDDALAGRGRLTLVVGEPGIGKTRLADEIASLGARRGLPVVWGRSWEAGGAPAYWPWLEALAAFARALDDRTLAEALGDGAPQVAELVPEIARRLSAGAPTAAPPEEARFRFWRGVAALVRRAAAPGGMVLVFEDLHAADRSSLALLYFVARELRSMRVLLVATCRDVEARLDPEAGELIARIGREGATVALPRLDRDAAADLVRRRAGAVAPALESRIFESTQGNPLYVEEMLRLLGDEGPEAIAAGVVPRGVRDVIRQRLDRVAGEARALLDLAAVAGDELDLALLAAAAGRPRAAVAVVAADAARVGVLVDRGGRPRFAHALVREVLYRDLEDGARRSLHARVAAALEGARGADASLPFAELAYHTLEGPQGGIERAVGYAVQASARALALLAHDEAIAVLERAVAAVEAAGNAAGLRARVVLALGEARIRRGESVAGRSACCEAAALARAIGDADLLGRAALAYGQVFMFAVVDPILVGMLEEALAAQPAGPTPMRARLLARLGAALQPARRPEEPVAVVHDAIAVARQLGASLEDKRVLHQTLHDGLAALMDVVDARERLPLNLEAEQLATALGDRERLLRTHARLALDYLALADFSAADARIEAFAALAAELRAPWFAWRASQFRTVRALIDGRFADAERFARQAWDEGRAAKDPQVDRAMTTHREGMLRTMERHDELVAFDPQVRHERAAYNFGAAWQSMGSALVFARIEDVDKTRTHLDLVPRDMFPPTYNLFTSYFLCEPVALAGTAAEAALLYDLVLPWAEQNLMLGMAVLSWEGPVTRVLGLLAARLGRWDESRAHFEEAIARLARIGARPHLARTEYELARSLLARGLAADRERARALLASALAAAEAIGMPGLVRLAKARLASAAAPTTSPSPSPPRPPSPAPTPSPAPSVPSSSDAFSMSLEGEYWSITHAGVTVRLKDSLGLQYLAQLVAAPGREVHVLDLAGGAAAGGGDAPVVDQGDAGELLDDEARAGYKRRLEDLRDTLEEAESFGDAARAARAREEIDFLGAELSRAVGLGGRGRRAGSAAERARSAVQRRIKNALDRITEAAPALGATLARGVKTGNFCVFRPG
jgi:tetratricopeptide (TPR) repeat protein